MYMISVDAQTYSTSKGNVGPARPMQCTHLAAINWDWCLTSIQLTIPSTVWQIKAECLHYTLVIAFHMVLYGCGRGRGAVAARRPSRWHILSSGNIMDDHSDWGTLRSISNCQDMTMRKTCEGDSNLQNSTAEHSSEVVLSTPPIKFRQTTSISEAMR